MTVKVRAYVKSKHAGYEADIRFKWPDGTSFRRRYRAPVNTKGQAQRWGEDLERRIYAQGKNGTLARSKHALVLTETDNPKMKEDTSPKRSEPANTNGKEVPTLKEFWPRFIAGHCVANRHKPSGIERKECAFRTWIELRLGSKRLDDIQPEDIVSLKAALASSSAKTANNVLTALSACLKFAGPEGLRGSEGLGIIGRVPRIRLLKIDSDEVPSWYEVADYKRLVEAAARIDPRVHLLVLLGGSAGLRRGEIIALQWSDIDTKRRILHVRRSIWWGKDGQRHETVPKGGKGRDVDMTAALADALKGARSLRGRVLTRDDGGELTNKVVRRWFARAQRAAGLEVTGAIHRLRHTFCSILAAEGATPKAIQALAGHESIETTMKYMHLSPASRAAAIGLLDAAWQRPEGGETVEKVAAAGA